MVDKEVEMTPDEVVEYVKNNFKEFDKVEISYDRIFAEGEVLGIDLSEYNDVPGCKILVSLDGETINSTVELDIVELKDDIIELYHYPQEGESIFIDVL